MLNKKPTHPTLPTMNKEQIFQELTTRMQEINDHHCTKVAVLESELLRETTWLTDSDWLEAQETGYRVLVRDLVTFLCEHMISPKGGNSNIYYEARRNGFKLRVGESDSFGPLSCVLTGGGGEWCVMYG